MSNMEPSARVEYAATSRVWMATRRQGLAFHAVEARHTKCGRHIGDITKGVPAKGILPTRREAEQEIHGAPCLKCFSARPSHIQPNVVPSKDRQPVLWGWRS